MESHPEIRRNLVQRFVGLPPRNLLESRSEIRKKPKLRFDGVSPRDSLESRLDIKLVVSRPEVGWNLAKKSLESSRDALKSRPVIFWYHGQRFLRCHRVIQRYVGSGYRKLLESRPEFRWNLVLNLAGISLKDSLKFCIEIRWNFVQRCVRILSVDSLLYCPKILIQ